MYICECVSFFISLSLSLSPFHHQVEATDQDTVRPYGDITYRIIDGGAGVFALNINTGINTRQFDKHI